MSRDTFITDAPAKPSLFCVGVVTEVENGHLSDSENYMVIPITITAKDAGKDTKIQFLYQPNWFTKEFNSILGLRAFKSENINEKGNLSGSAWVYSNNINNISDDEHAVSVLRGICGSQAKFEELSDRLLNLEVPAGADGPTVEDVTNTFREFLETSVGKDGQPMLVGYTLEQESKRTGEINPETGKNVYVKTKKYVIARKNSFFDVTKKNLAYFTRNAEKSAIKGTDGEPTGEFYRKMTFTEQVPF